MAARAARAFRPTCSTAVTTIAGARLRVAWTNSGLCAAEHETLAARREIEHRLERTLVDAAMPATLRRALEQAAKGRADDFPLDLSWARDFEREVLIAAREIPYGQTRSYAWLARAARRPLAVRAAATVMARNPLWLVIPCHRVIYSDGTLGPYGSSGQARKRALLEREGVKVGTPHRTGQPARSAAGHAKKRSSGRPRSKR